jgi:hypothetical protein
MLASIQRMGGWLALLLTILVSPGAGAVSAHVCAAEDGAPARAAAYAAVDDETLEPWGLIGYLLDLVTSIGAAGENGPDMDPNGQTPPTTEGSGATITSSASSAFPGQSSDG